MSETTLAEALKKLVEGVRPDLRKHMRLTLLGKVTAVYEDEYRVDVVVGEEPDALALPRVPVASLFAQDGYGVWALPEVDAEVSVSFYEGDVTRPYVEAPVYHTNQPPQGFTTGTIAIVGKAGQKVILKPDSSEVVVIAESIKTISTGRRQAVTSGDAVDRALGNRHEETGGSKTVVAEGGYAMETSRRSLKVKGVSQEEHGRLEVRVKGEEKHKVTGNAAVSVGGNMDVKVLGNYQHGATGARQEIVGGSYSLVVANGPTPQPVGYSVDVSTGNVSINTRAGLILLGGQMASSPAVLGTELVAQLNALVQVFVSNAATFTGPVSVGAPAQISPTVVAALQAWASGLANVLSQCVMIKKLPTG